MKLLTKTTLNFLSVTLFIFLFGILAFYFVLRNQVEKNVNLELEKRRMSIVDQMQASVSSNVVPPNPNERVLMSALDENAQIPDSEFTDTLIYDHNSERYIPFRKLGFIAEINGNKIYVQIFKSLEESDLLIVRIFLVLTVLVIALIVSLLIMNRITLEQSWKAFYDTIKKISTYNVNKHEQFSLQSSDISEFDDLNRVIQTMTDRINTDYLNLKEYTENASHEIQNPLAIINSKLELLMQSGELKENQYKAVFEAYEASNRLSRLNTTLILLSKIESRQFPESEEVNLHSIINRQLEFLEDIIESKELNINVEIDKDFTVSMNPYLAEILFMNIIKNAIRHNVEKGNIQIQLDSGAIKVCNTGKELEMNSEEIFKRFNKSSNSSESLGLGLSIVKKICEIYQFDVEYFYDQMHCFSVTFNVI